MRGTGRFFVRSKDYFRMPFGFNAGKVDAVAGNTPLLTYSLPKSPKVFRVFFEAHSNRCLHINGNPATLPGNR
jgi:hypothetical protein